MSPQSRRGFVLSAGALAAYISMIGQVIGATAVQAKADEPPVDLWHDLSAHLPLYGANRQELLAATPLAALTLIGTGEIWRVEFGQVVKSYRPTPWIAKVKGLMHGVIATEATWARLVSGKSLNAAREDASALTAGLSDAIKNAAIELPAETPCRARCVGDALQRRCRPAGPCGSRLRCRRVFRDNDTGSTIDLDNVLNATGEAIYQSVVRNLQAFARESKPRDWERCLVGVWSRVRTPGQHRDRHRDVCDGPIRRRNPVVIPGYALPLPPGLRQPPRLLLIENSGRRSSQIRIACGVTSGRSPQDPCKLGGFFLEMGKPIERHYRGTRRARPKLDAGRSY